MPEFDQSLYWKLVPYFRVPMETVHVILVVSGPSLNHNLYSRMGPTSQVPNSSPEVLFFTCLSHGAGWGCCGGRRWLPR